MLKKVPPVSSNPPKTTDDYLNQLVKKMTDDFIKSPQNAIDRGAVEKNGNIEHPNKLEPAVQEELKKFLKEFSKESKEISNKINKLKESYKDENDFKKEYDKFVEKYNNNFKDKTDKDLFDKGFNAKEVVDSFDKAYDEAKKLNDKSVLDRMDDIKKDVDKYIRPIDNLARGDQGTALVARDNMKNSLQDKDGPIAKLNKEFSNPELESSLENLSKELDKPLSSDRNLSKVNEEISQAAEKVKSNLSEENKSKFDNLYNQVKSATDVYEKMDKISFSGVSEKDGEAVLDQKNLGFEPEQAAKGYLQYMREYHRDEIKPNLDRMNELAEGTNSEEKNIDYDKDEIEALEKTAKEEKEQLDKISFDDDVDDE